MDKQELLKQITQVRENKKQLTEKRELERLLYESDKEAYKEADEKLQEARRKYYEFEQAVRKSKESFNKITAEVHLADDELERLKRELERLEDAERLQQAYEDKLSAYDASSKYALWRAENNPNGEGAFPYQIEGAAQAAIAERAILGDERGLGKTLTSVIWWDFVGAQKIIAVVPNSTVDTYCQEVSRWSNRSVYRMANFSKDQRRVLFNYALAGKEEFVIVINYEAWRRDDSVIDEFIRLQPDTLVMDEAHQAKEWSSVTATGLRKLRFTPNHCPSCSESNPEHFLYDDDKMGATCMKCAYHGEMHELTTIKNVLPMTGSPILNKPQELYPHLRMIMPDLFKSLRNFERDFCMQKVDEVEGKKKRYWTWQPGGKKRLLDKIGPRFIRRTREDAGIVIPKNTVVRHSIPYQEVIDNYPDQANAYQQARDYAWLILDQAEEVVMSMPVMLTVLLRLRQVITCPSGVKLEVKDPVTEEIIKSVRLDVTESIKIDRTVELVKEIVEEGSRATLFSQQKEPLHLLQKKLEAEGIRAVILDGDTPRDIRGQISYDFDRKTASKDNYKWDIVLCNYKTARQGINLHAATHAIFIDREWNDEMEDQATGRIDRLGQTEETTTHIIEVMDTVDTWMDELIKIKEEMVSGFHNEHRVLAEKMREALIQGIL